MEALPNYVTLLLDGFADRRKSALLRTEMESGPPKQIKFQSKPMKELPVTLYFDSLANWNSFNTWFAQNLNEGADWFTMTDPVRGGTIQARFAGDGLEGIPTSGAMTAWTCKQKIEFWG